MPLDNDDRIYIAPKRGRLPRRYEEPWSVQKKLRLIAVAVLIGAAIYFGIYLVLR